MVQHIEVSTEFGCVVKTSEVSTEYGCGSILAKLVKLMDVCSSLVRLE